MHSNVKLIVYHCLGIVLSTVALFILSPMDKTASPVERTSLVACFLLIFEPIKVLAVGFIGYKGRERDKSPLAVLWDKSYVSKNLSHLALSLLCLTITVTFVILSLGGPLVNDLDQTFFLALSITFISVLPILVTESSSSSLSLSSFLVRVINFLFSSSTKLSQWDSSFAMNLKLISLFSWFGAFLLKLDWIVPWKIYPITSLMASLYGYLVASLVNIVLISVRF
ncbi:uncharacterized protein LOC128386123 [Panonychus citri]|uniref:uncharacterized protein LOC128386123 n=1 Tax=Panonychus citri TaxID=50023 RepID=UPI002306E2E0|nr:uncharacterized protein LOC128386123 [Panonychus citri]XP_053201081.1 uncharacterized protein LOC128386123 [Panonychus citri]